MLLVRACPCTCVPLQVVFRIPSLAVELTVRASDGGGLHTDALISITFDDSFDLFEIVNTYDGMGGSITASFGPTVLSNKAIYPPVEPAVKSFRSTILESADGVFFDSPVIQVKWWLSCHDCSPTVPLLASGSAATGCRWLGIRVYLPLSYRTIVLCCRRWRCRLATTSREPQSPPRA